MILNNYKTYKIIYCNYNKYLIKFFFITLLLIFALINHSSLANENINNITTQQDLIIRNQQSIIDYETRQKEQTLNEQELDKKALDTSTEKYFIEQETDKKNCKIVKKLMITNSTILSQNMITQLENEIIGKCFGTKKISKIIEKILEFYDLKGYVTTEVETIQSRIDQGIIELRIIEKKVEEIIFNDNKLSNLQKKLQKFTAFRKIEGKILNHYDLDQGLYQINRLQSNKAKYRIDNGSDRFSNKVYIENNKKFPARLALSHDNLGNRSTGIFRTAVNGSFDNLLSLNENLNLAINTNINDNQNTRDIKTYSANLYLPLGYYSFSVEGSKSDFFGKDLNNRNFSGYSQRYSLILNKLFTDNNEYRISGKIGFTKKETGSYLENVKVRNSQRNLSIFNISVLATYFLDNSSTLFFKPNFLKGINALGAYRDYSFTSPSLDFTIFKFFMSYQKKTNIFNLNKPIAIVSEIDTQIANKTLFGSEQFSIGGYTTVRGFRERNIAAENGFLNRNKIEFNIGSLANKLDINNNYLNKTKIEPFVDYGYIRRNFNNKSSRIAGTGFKTSFNTKSFNASLTFSWALKQSKMAVSNYRENSMIYFEISGLCCNF
ncbi:MAG: hypothetical protein RL769_169 [Pseudomonadota bacterium]